MDSEVEKPFPNPYTGMRKIVKEDTTEETTDLAAAQGWQKELTKTITSDDFRAINSGQKVIYVVGLIKYRDTFQRCQVDEFRLRTDGKIETGQLTLFTVVNIATDPDLPCDRNPYGRNKAIYPPKTN
jgi:hypothetical protein